MNCEYSSCLEQDLSLHCALCGVRGLLQCAFEIVKTRAWCSLVKVKEKLFVGRDLGYQVIHIGKRRDGRVEFNYDTYMSQNMQLALGSGGTTHP